MIRSMTGFGRATGQVEEEQITIELSSVNHRFLDCSFRLPGSWSMLESTLRETVKQHIARGKLNIIVRRERALSNRFEVQCDTNVAQQYVDASSRLADIMHSTEALSLDVLAQMDGVFYQDEKSQDIKSVEAAIKAVLSDALQQLDARRETEGTALDQDLRERIQGIIDALAVVEGLLPEITVAYEERLRNRVAELSVDTEITEDRLALELALLSEKMDVNEEIVRLKAHFDHVNEHLAASDPIGRELNFLAQEIQREINTLGSKLRDVDVTREVLRMKSELEKFREQIQNVE